MSRIIAIISLLLATACSHQPISVEQESVADVVVEPKPASQDKSEKPPKPTKAAPLSADADIVVQTRPIKTPTEVAIEAVHPEPIQIPSVWQRLFKLYALPATDNRRIRQEIQWLTKNPDYVDRVQKRAEPFLHFIVNQIETHGLPGEIALLPIVESAFRPHANSNHQAAGIWQFIPETGLRFGLKQSWWYDGRRDVYDSTQGAIRYLKKLEQRFQGDWLLALAAYNTGENKVGREIKRNRQERKQTDFWSLRLPLETRAYVPRLIALSKFFAAANEYGVMLRYIPDQPVFKPVHVGSQLDLALAAELAEISIDELYRLNPGFKRWATDPDGPHRLILPVDTVGIFENRLAQVSVAERVGRFEHSVKSGENISKIAQRYGASVSVVQQLNQLEDTRLYVGQILSIPGPKRKPSSYHQPGLQLASITPLVTQKADGQRHTVRLGDTLWDIARQYSVSMRNLATWNNLSPKKYLLPGQQLLVAPASEGTGEIPTIDYTVRKGDSLFLIARRFNVKIADLRRWNADKLGKYLIPGQTIICVCGS